MQKNAVCCGKLLRVAAWSFLAIVLLCGCDHARTNLAQHSEPRRQEVIALHDITVDQGKAFLDKLGLGTVSLLPDLNAVSVSGSADELLKARAVLGLVDTKDEFVIQTLGPAAALGLIETRDDESVARTSVLALKVRTLPTNDQIARDLGDMTIGTFADPPQSVGHPQAIVDVHGASVFAIVPACRLQEVLAAANLGPETVGRQGGAALQYARSDESSVQATAEQRFVETPLERVAAGTSGRQTSAQARVEPESFVDPKVAVVEEHPATSERISVSTVARSASPNSVRPSLESATFGASDPLPGVQTTTGAEPLDDASVISAEKGQDAGRRRVMSEPATDPNSEVRGATAKPSGNGPGATTVSQPYEVESLANANDILELEMPEKIELIRLLDLVGEYLHLDYMYDPDKIKNQMITLKLHGKLRGEIRVKDLYSLLESVLNYRGFVMTRHDGNLVTIAPLADVMQIDPELVDAESRIVDAGDMVVTRMFELEYIDAFSAVSLLENMKLTVAVSPIVETRRLIITCYAYRMPRIESVLAMIDRPGKLRKVRFRQLQYITANMLAEKIKTIAPELETTGVTVALAPQVSPRPGGAGPLPVPVQPSVTAGGTPLTGQTVYLDADDRTNRILIIGYERQVETVEELVETFDVPQQALRVFHVYELMQVEAREVADKLQELGIIGQDAPVQTTPPASAPKPPSPFGPEVSYVPGGPLVEEPRVVVLEATNALLIGATREQHSQIAEIISYIDKVQQDFRVLKVYDIEHTDAKEARDKLAELGICGATTVTGGVKPASPAGTPPAPGTPSLAASRASQTSEGFQNTLFGKAQVVVVESTNSLLVVATAEQHAQIETVLAYVDSPTREEEIPYKVYPLENSPPSHLAEVLGSLIQETVEDKEDKIERVTKKEEEITIVPDPNTYSLIVYASKKNQEWIASLVKQLDKRRPQVLIDATLVEITKADAFSYDLNILRSSKDLDSTSGITGVGVEPNAIGKLFEWGSGALGAFYGDEDIQILLSAMRSKSYGRVLAKPKLLVNDNEAGTIKTTDTTYVQTKSGIPVSSGAVGDQQNFVETSVRYEPYEAGITLDITPHISEGSLLQLDIKLTRSDFLKTNLDKPPDTRSNDVETAVTLPDGSTVILGGLLKMNQVKGGSKIPILGDIPIIGGLFRSISNEDTQSKLYVFVKAEIIRPAETGAHGMQDLERISERTRLEFEKHEDEFQRHETWPGIKPRPVSPPKVLDAQ